MGEQRKRLSRDERRAQLIEIGRHQVEASSFDELSTDAVADEAGISRGLLFHYFPTRRDFLVALAEDAAGELLDLTAPDESLPPLERLRAGLEAYLDYVTTRSDLYVALVRGAAGGSTGLQDVFEATRSRLAERILDGLALGGGEVDDALAFAARGYVALTEEVVVSWLRTDQRMPREELVDRLVQWALAALSSAGAPDDLLT
ncbi:MAG: TetR/AcrR family transcriptional regulator [Nitriliruptorales bacterium]|nr:TetR/AcrR family transcriptional regulator [Nitriliruptorales bacterium]